MLFFVIYVIQAAKAIYANNIYNGCTSLFVVLKNKYSFMIHGKNAIKYAKLK